MKKFLLSLLSVFAAMTTIAAAEEVTINTGSSYWPKNSSYNGTITSYSKYLGSSWIASYFNNNNYSGWSNIRCGSKSDASVASFYSEGALTSAISKIVVNTKYEKTGTNDKLTGVKLLVSSSSTFAAGSTTTIDYKNFSTAGDWAFEIPQEVIAANLYYKFEFDCPKSTNNGFLGVNSFTFTIYDGGGETDERQDAEISFSEESCSAFLSEDNNFPTLNNPNSLDVSFESSKPEVATVDADGNVTLVAAGETEISASFAGNDDFMPATVKYTLTVTDPNAITVDLTADGFNASNAYDVKTFKDKVTYTAVLMKQSSGTAIQFNTNNSNGKGSGIAVTAISDEFNIKSVEILFNSSDTRKGVNVYSKDTAFPVWEKTSAISTTGLNKLNSDAVTQNATIYVNAPAFAIVPNTTGAIYIDKVTVTYERKANKVEISSEVTDDNNAKVTLTYADPEATIYYGFAEDAITNVYTGPFVVEEDCTVYSFAQKDGANSPIASQSFKLYKSFKEILAKSEAKEHLIINGNFSVLGQSGNYLMVTDGQNNLMVYGCATTYEQGTAISSISGSVTFYNSLLEITEATLTEGGEGATYNVAEKTTLEGLNYTDNLFDQYTLLAATISNKKSTGTVATATITLLETETITLYNAFGITFNNGSNFNITGFIWRNGDVMEFVPTEIVEGEPIHMVEIPVITPNKKELQDGDKITISCATEAATIYYTLDESEPTQESTRYTGPFHFEGTDFTVKARAYYEGVDKVMLPSEIAERIYHVFNPYCNVITTHNHDVPSMATYYKHTCTVDGVDYQMYGAHDRVKGIQMKNQKETSSQAGRFCYIVQTGDNEGLALESIEVDFNTAPQGTESFVVMGSNVPYDVFGENTYDWEKEKTSINNNGELIGFIDAANTTVVFEKDYNYFAFFPLDDTNKNAIYMNSITVNYRDPMPADETEVPVIDETFEIISGREGFLMTDELPTHPNWKAKYTLNGSEPMDVSEGNIQHEQGIDGATLHTIEIWYEHYYHGVKSTPQTFYHLTQPNFVFYSDEANKKTVVNFTAIGEGVKVYFTLNGNKPEVAENGPANIIRRAGANGSTYVIDSTEDLSKTHVVTSDTKTVEIKHGIITNKDDNYVFTAQAVHDNGMSSDITEDDQVPTSIVEVNAAGSPDSQAVYDLQGRKVVAPKRGIYISNGVKRVY